MKANEKGPISHVLKRLFPLNFLKFEVIFCMHKVACPISATFGPGCLQHSVGPLMFGFDIANSALLIEKAK